MTTLSYKGFVVGRLYQCREVRFNWMPTGVVLLVAIHLHVTYEGGGPYGVGSRMYNNLIFLVDEQVKTFSYLPHEDPQSEWTRAI